MNVNDNINMEYEARVMLTEEQYLLIKEKYEKEHPGYKSSTNINHYFDTEDLYLTNHNMVLRLREVENKQAELTLKIQEENGCVEINHYLTDEQSKLLLENKVFPESEIIKKLMELDINIKSLKLVGYLKTERLEFQFNDHLFVIDKNYFKDREDFNLEVESDTENHAKSILIDKISPFGITYKKDYINKAKRAIYNL